MHELTGAAERARRLDSTDVLAAFRSRFYLHKGQIYLDGNSLGLMSIDAESGVLTVLDSWKRHGIEGWLQGEPAWFTLAEELGGKMATVVGAQSEEVVVTNSTTVNLHQLLATLFHPAGRRTKILADALNFPSDLYAIRSHLALRGLDPETNLKLVESRDGRRIETTDILDALTNDVAVAVLPMVQYRCGDVLDVAQIAPAASEHGIVLGLDCSHSIGVLPHSLDDWGVDFAFWCTYKYLNGGPGSAGGLYLNRRHFGKSPGLAGWFGSLKARQFEMNPEMIQARDSAALQIGTPNILSMAPLIGTIPMLVEAGIERIRAKSLSCTNLLIESADVVLHRHGFKIVSPRDAENRGGHVALAHREASRICRALRANGVVPDFRPPDIVRLAPSPLYTRHADCVDAVERLDKLMRSRAYENLPAAGDQVS